MQNLHLHHFLFCNLFFLVETSLDSRALTLSTDCPSKFNIPSMSFCSFAIQLSLTSSYSLPAVHLSPQSTSEQVSSSVVVTHPRTIEYKGRWGEMMMSQTCHPIETRLNRPWPPVSLVCEKPSISDMSNLHLPARADCCPLRGSF